MRYLIALTLALAIHLGTALLFSRVEEPEVVQAEGLVHDITTFELAPAEQPPLLAQVEIPPVMEPIEEPLEVDPPESEPEA